MKKTLLTILTVVLAFCSVGLVACGHTCVYDKEVANTSTLAQEATCTSPALYYYSCECGNNGTDMFEVGEALGHSYTAETVKDDALITAASCQNAETYHKSCVNCGEVSTSDDDVFTVGEVLKHNYDINNNCLCTYGCGKSNQFVPRRVGEETNTLFFFDQAIGADQISIVNNAAYWYKYTPEFSTEKKLGEETGSLAINIEKRETYTEEVPKNEGEETKVITWNTAEYEFNEGDYVSFYVYNATASDVVDISLGTSHRERCFKGQWTLVLWKASDVVANANSYLYQYNYGSDNFAGMSSGTDLSGALYFSKAKVYSAEQVKDLKEVEDTFEYTVGSVTLIGKAGTSYLDGNYNGDPSAFNDAFYLNPHYVNGVLAYHIHDKRETSGLQKPYAEPRIELTLKDTYDLANCYVYITIKGAVENDIYMQAFSTTGHFATCMKAYNNLELFETLADGSQVYKFNLAQYANAGGNAINFKSFRLCVRQNIAYPVNAQIVISNISIVNEMPQA